VLTTENAALAAQLAAVDIQVRRVNATVLLVKGLGGTGGKPHNKPSVSSYAIPPTLS
jgi:outer membrane protein TolC